MREWSQQAGTPKPCRWWPFDPFSVLTLQGSPIAQGSRPPVLTPQLCPFAENAGILSAHLSSLHSRCPQVTPLLGNIGISVTQQIEAERFPLKRSHPATVCVAVIHPSKRSDRGLSVAHRGGHLMRFRFCTSSSPGSALAPRARFPLE